MWFPFALSFQTSRLIKRVENLNRCKVPFGTGQAYDNVLSGIGCFNISCQSIFYAVKSIFPGTAAFKDRCSIAKRINTAFKLVRKAEEVKNKPKHENKTKGSSPYSILPRKSKSDGDININSQSKDSRVHGSPIAAPKRSKSTENITINNGAFAKLVFK